MDDERALYWRRKLRRLRLGAEPLATQLDLHRRTTLALSAVCGFIAALFLAIFTSFGRPDLGAIVDVGFLGPVVAMAWLDCWSLARGVAAYEREGGR